MRRHEAPSEPRPTALKRPVPVLRHALTARQQSQCRQTRRQRVTRQGGNSAGGAQRPVVGTPRSCPGPPAKPQEAPGPEREPDRAGPVPARAGSGPGPLPERPQRKQARHVPSKTGTRAGGRPGKPRVGFRGSAAGRRGRAEERRPRIACASRATSAALLNSNSYKCTTEEKRGGRQKPNMEAGPQTGLEGPRNCGPPFRGLRAESRGRGPKHKTYIERMNGPKTVPTRTPRAATRDSSWPTRRPGRDIDWRS